MVISLSLGQLFYAIGSHSTLMIFDLTICSVQSYFGANVLHPRTIIPVMKDNIPIVIRNMFNISAPGTVICKQPGNENADLDACVKSFATIDNLALVNVEG